MTGRARGRARGRAKEQPPQRPGSGAPVPQAAPAPQGAVGGDVGPPSQQSIPIPQGVPPGAAAEAPQPPASGRASYRGSGKPQRPGNGGAGALVEGMEQMALGERGRGPRRLNPYEDGNYRPEHIADKRGTQGTEMALKGNFFKLKYAPDWRLYQYHVDFLPPIESKKMKGALLASHKEKLGDVRAFDGLILYLPMKLEDEETVLHSLRNHDNAMIKITIRFTCELPPRTTQTLQVMNIIWRRILGMMGMTQINRHHFSLGDSISVSAHDLEVIPGFQTSILQYEKDVLLEIDIAHKILRTNTVLDELYKVHAKTRPEDFHSTAAREIVGTIVMTRYNNKTYRVDDIDWNKRPADQFQLSNGNNKSYLDYYFEHYQIRIQDQDQPLLVSRPKKRDIRRGQAEMLYLVPELCTITGLSDNLRSNYSVMRDVAVHTRIAPDGRVDKLVTFMNSIKRNQKVVDELAKWQLSFQTDLVDIKGRQLPQENIIMQDRGRDVSLSYKQDDADWSRDMRGKKMRLAVELRDWIVLFPRNSFDNAKELVYTLSQVGPPMGMGVQQPKMLELPNDRNESYLMTLRENVTKSCQMAVCILTNNKKDRYDAIKKFCCIDCPVPSQMVLMNTLKKQKQLMSVATKIAIQMNCKMGGVVWGVTIPLKGTMIVGIDTYHDSSARGRSCGGVVATTNADFTRYFSTVSFQMSHLELQNHLRVGFAACMRAFHKGQNALPEKIIVFRDGVGDGQLEAVHDHELPQITTALTEAAGTEYHPSVAYIIVKKRINSRFFRYGNGRGDSRGAPINPPPGTIIDEVATKHCWYDFFLVSQSVRQGTVGPTHYNIIHDSTGLKPDHFQRLTYKLTHMYYNWQGTIRVPAPCMYAHKLAFLCGQSLHREFHAGLADKLFFL